MHITEEHGSEMLPELNNLHPALKFTCEQENDGKLPFVDVDVHKKLVEDKRETIFEISICHKPTFTGQYTRWDAFTALRYKST